MRVSERGPIRGFVRAAIVAAAAAAAPCMAAGEPEIVDIGAGGIHSHSVCEGGAALGSGGNGSGQIGDGTTVDRSSPVEAIAIRGARTVASTSLHTVAVDRDGDVWAWGGNFVGQLGEPSAGFSSSVPVRVATLSDVVAIAAGWFHSLAVRSDGTVWAWGGNTSGQLGTGTVGFGEPLPVPTVGIRNVIALAAGERHSIALDAAGTIWTWGNNAYGQLGDGTNTNSTVPVVVRGLTSGTAVAAAREHSMALLSDGTVWTWGRNRFGQLGDGTGLDSDLPVPASRLRDVRRISAAGYHSLALDRLNVVWAWGDNRHGEFGDGTTVSSDEPVRSEFGRACRKEN